MRRLMIIAAAFAASLSVAAVARAESRSSYCGYGEFVSEAQDKVDVYRVAIPGRTYFHSERAGCPEGPSCRLKSYLIGKNEILVSKIESGWACAWYGDARRHTVGWLRAADLVKAAPASAGLDWEGTWFLSDDDQITITRDGGGLRVTGDATWKGPASERSGYFDGVLKVDGPHAVHSDAQGNEPPICIVRFRRIARYLIVDDNDRCGGMSVSFDGVYRRD